MGLFGYNQKDYAKNTAAFKTQIVSLMEKLSGEFGVGKILDAARSSLDFYRYPNKANGKELEAVDKRIQSLIDSLFRDVQQKNPAMASEHAKMLLSAVEDSRQYGKEAFNAEDLKAAEQLAVYRGRIFNDLNKKGEIEKQKAKLIEQAKRASSQAEQMKIKLLFDEQKQQEAMLDKNVAQNTLQHNALVKVISTREVGKTAREIQADDTISVAAFAREAAETNAIIAKNSEKGHALLDVASDFDNNFGEAHADVGSDTEFYDLLHASQNDDLENSIGSASVGSSDEHGNDEFWSQLK